MNTYKRESVKENFSRAADYYARHANLQRDTAGRMARALEPWQYSVPDGPVIEIGAGTGFFTSHLVRMFPGHDIEITDAAPQMVEHCKREFSGRERLKFKVLDAETVNWQEESNALVVGNFVAQWFKDPSAALSKMAASLKPGGFMLVSFPGSESFPHWRKYCLELGLPFTGNPLPDVEKVVVNLSMGPVKVDYYEDQSSESYEDLYSFFRHMKQAGLATSFTGKRLAPKQLRLLNDHWLKQNDGKIVVHYHTAFIAVKRDL